MPEKRIPRELLEMRERLNARVRGPYIQPNPNAPPVEVPPMWRRPHIERGTITPEARTIERLLSDFFPNLRGNISTITSGYGPRYINLLTEQADMPESNPRTWNLRNEAKDLLSMIQPTNILGIAHEPTRSIEINAPIDQFEDTMFHEMSHLTQPPDKDFSQYLRDEQEAQDLEKLYKTYKMDIVSPQRYKMKMYMRTKRK